MDMQSVQMAAGVGSSLIFVSSNLPMVLKALRTKNLRSYSPAHIGLANLGNLIHWLYLVSLPFGPIWFLHGFNTLVALLMLAFYLRYEGLKWPQTAVFPRLLLHRLEALMNGQRPLAAGSEC